MSQMYTNPPETPKVVDRDRQVIVTDNGSRDTGAGVVIAAVLGLLAVLFIGWLLFNGGDAVDESPFPDQVNINTDDGQPAPPPADSGDTTVNNFEAPPANDEPPADEPPADSTTTGSTTG